MGVTSTNVPENANPVLPSFACMAYENRPPAVKSLVACVVSQSGEALFQFLMCCGSVQYCQTIGSGA